MAVLERAGRGSGHRLRLGFGDYDNRGRRPTVWSPIRATGIPWPLSAKLRPSHVARGLYAVARNHRSGQDPQGCAASSAGKTINCFEQKIDEQPDAQWNLASKWVQDVNRLRDQR